MEKILGIKYCVYRSAFHGGSKIYEGDDIKRAFKEADMDHNNRTCCCGGCIITVTEEGKEETSIDWWGGEVARQELRKIGIN